MMKQSKRLNGHLKPEHKQTTNSTTMAPTTNTDSQAPTISIVNGIRVLLLYCIGSVNEQLKGKNFRLRYFHLKESIYQRCRYEGVSVYLKLRKRDTLGRISAILYTGKKLL